MKTTQPKESEVKHEWHLIDATDKPAGRLAVELCRLLRGRGKPDYTPHIDMGDFVVVINTAKVGLTGSKDKRRSTRSTPASRAASSRPPPPRCAPRTPTSSSGTP